MHDDVRPGLDAIDQILRHSLAERATANQQVYFRNVAREEDSALTGGVTSSDDDYFAPSTERRFDGGRPVVDAATLEVGQVRQVGPAVAGAARDHHDGCANGYAQVELQLIAAICRGAQQPDLRRNRHGRAEFLRLRIRASGEGLS